MPPNKKLMIAGGEGPFNRTLFSRVLSGYVKDELDA
jgi:hypothetical protein